MKSLSRIKLVISGLLLFFPAITIATNGTFIIGTGAKHRSMGGAGVALPLDSMSLAINPAHAGHLGTQLGIDGMVFYAKRRACTRAVPDCEVSGSNLFFLPSGGAAYKFNRKVGMGFIGYAAAGGSTRYSRDIYTAGGPEQTTGVDLKQMIMAPSISYSASKTLTVGVAPLIAVQQFRAYGLDNFRTIAVTSDPDAVTNNGNDWSYGGGVRLGALAQFYDKKLALGVSYSSRIYMTDFDKYKGLFSPDGDFDIPENFTIGIALKPTDKLSIAFDVQRIYFSDVQAIGNSITNTIGTAGTPPLANPPLLGDNGGGGFGWDDQTVYKLGLRYAWDPKLTLSVGANYGESPIPDDDNLLPAAVAPATTEWHATAGFSYMPSKASEISLTYVHAFKKEQSNYDTGQFNISPGGGATIEMVQNSVNLTYSFLF